MRSESGMDPNRFDNLSKAVANRSTRRSALTRLGLSGLVGAAAGGGLAREVFAANGDKTCVLQLHARTAVGPHAKTISEGPLTLVIGANGAIDSGTFDDGNGGDQPTVAGQTTGRVLTFRFDFPNGDSLAFEGTAAQDLSLCRGRIDGTFGGPGESDLGTWRATAGTGTGTGGSSGGNAVGGNAVGGNATGGNAVGGNSAGGSNPTKTPGSGGNGASACASGVVCGGVCCVARAGFTPDTISCDGGSCSCSYSCAAGGCPGGDPSAVIKIGCEDRPNALCGEFCNVVPPDNSTSGNGGNSGSSGGTCPNNLQLCDGSTPCCIAFSPYEATDISCIGGTCRCMYSCAQAGCTSNSTSTFMTIACAQNPNDQCASLGCN